MAILCLFTTSAFAQFTRNDAIDLVLNTILADDIGVVNVCASNNSFTTDVELIDNNSESNPYTESWVFFSDDDPFASWYHDSRLIYVSTVDGSYIISNAVINPKGIVFRLHRNILADRFEPVAMDGIEFVPDPQKGKSIYIYDIKPGLQLIASNANPAMKDTDLKTGGKSL